MPATAKALAVIQSFAAKIGRIDQDRLTVNGGAIALGHPIGASGTRILVTLLHLMRRRGCRRGLATLDTDATRPNGSGDVGAGRANQRAASTLFSSSQARSAVNDSYRNEWIPSFRAAST